MALRFRLGSLVEEWDPRMVRSIRRASWTAGEVVHRRLADRLARDRDASDPATAGNQWGGLGEPVGIESITRHRPFRPKPMESVSNPVLTAADVTDYGNADFVADPFLFPSDAGEWHLFFEVYNSDRTPTAVIGHATSTDGGRSWEYDEVVLRDEIHLAFPYVFEWQGAFYMVPDRWNRQNPASVRLYRTEELPNGWRKVSTIVRPDHQLTDCVVFRWNDRWWAIMGGESPGHGLFVYYADDLLTAGWTPHERNPVVSRRPSGSRPGGRPIVGEDGIVLFLQDLTAKYGEKVRTFEIERLSPTEYVDRERSDSLVLEASNRFVGWNSGRMHHIDPWYTTEGWLCAVDGNIGFGDRVFGHNHWSIGMYQA